MQENSGISRRRMLQLTGTTAFAAAALGVAGCKKEEPEEPKGITLSVYDPSGSVAITQQFTERLDTLDGKTIAFLGNGMWEEERCFELLEKLMKEAYPNTTIITADNFPRHSDKLTPANNGIAAMMQERGVDGVIVGNAGWGSCGTACGRAAAQLEIAGIPTTIIVRQGFETIVNNAFVGFGFPSDSPVNIVFPSEMFNTGSDLTPFEEGFQQLLSGLTDWEPKPIEAETDEAKMIDFTAMDYADLYAQVQHYFMRNSWSDSLPIVPPTEEYVNWILRGTDEDPNSVVGTVPPRNGICTVRNVAILLAMAGGRPEYLPFLIAAVKCAVNPNAAMQNWNATTNSVFPVFVVNGPERMNLRLGSGYGCLGPDPAHPAGQVMGRAIRLLQQVMGGAIPGVGTMALYGANRATNAFFAEDEEGIPETWTSWAEDRGFSRDKNVVTMTIALGAANAIWTYGTAAKNLTALNMMAATLRQPDRNRYSQGANYKEDNDDYASGVVFINRDVAAHLVNDNGMSKLDVKKYLWENSFTTFEDLESWGSLGAVRNSYPDIKAGDSIPVCPKPEVLTIVVAGGDQGGHGYYMGGIDQGNVVSNEVVLPACWDDLLIDASIDLGAAPAMH